MRAAHGLAQIIVFPLYGMARQNVRTMFNPHDFSPGLGGRDSGFATVQDRDRIPNPESRIPGLYRPEDEHDACGVGFVVDIKGRKSNAIVRKAMEVLINLEHRGACGCEANTGDGAGILIQTPDKFFRKAVPFSLPDPGSYGSGLVFLPRDERDRASIRNLIATVVEQEGAKLLGWRDVPSDNRLIGDSAKATQPVFQQVFIDVSSVFSDADSATARNAKAERKLYIIRKRIENAVDSISINAL
jgi:glutamate synthase domain-containing protein 1